VIEDILQSGGDDFPTGGVPIRQRRSIIPYIILAVVIILVVFIAANIWLNWTINESMYETKAGLDWFGINFYGGLTFVVGSLLALLFVNPIPRRSDIFEAFNALMGLQYRNPYLGQYGQQRRIRPLYIRPSKTLWAFWQAVKWLILFAVFSASNGFPGLGNLTFVMDMESRGFGSWSLVPRIFELPLVADSGQGIIGLMPTMELEYFTIVYVGTVVAIVLALRFFLKFIRDIVIRAGDKWIRNIFVALTAIIFAVFLQIPYWAMDVRIPYEWGAITTVMIACFSLAIYYHVKSTREAIPLAQRRRAGIVAVAIIIGVILLFNIGAYAYYSINWNNNWVAYQWDPLTSKQVQVTQWAAGIQNISTSSITSVPNGNVSKTLSLIRQWDSTASLVQSKNEIGVNWLQLTESPQISFVYGQEYWVNPTTFNYPTTSQDWVSEHLIYTHSSKIIVMNTHTGQFVPVTSAFNLTSQPLMYYGEGCLVPANCSATSPLNGFLNDVYVGVPHEPGEIENVTYSGKPDYTLCGAQRTIWFLAQGQPGFAFFPPANCINMLHNRDVFNRVQSLLINGLTEDPSTYMVTDSNQPGGGDDLFFAIQIYIDYPLHSAFASGNDSNGSPGSYLRPFGVVLVNVANGDLQGYYLGQSDGFLTSFYHEYYPNWKPVPKWLQDQLRYPEALLGNQNIPGQLNEDFIWHVDQASQFRSSSDFFTIPEDTEILYIPFVVGNNVSFAAVQLVQFANSQGQNLAGMYVVYGGTQFGQFHLYESNSTTFGTTTFFGPEAALNKFTSDPTTRTAKTLDGAVSGNILLYPVNGHLFYFVPAYVFPSSQASGAVVAQNPFIDVIDAENANASVRFIPTNSSLDSNYGFQGTAIPTNSSSRLAYVNSLFAKQGIALTNATVNTGAIPVVHQFNDSIIQYTVDSENASATNAINQFISNEYKPANSTGTGIVDSTIYYWKASPGLIDYGFLVSRSGVAEFYYLSVYIGT
jgi:TRAP-type C4-dicarboxylate transport system permease small subunit